MGVVTWRPQVTWGEQFMWKQEPRAANPPHPPLPRAEAGLSGLPQYRTKTQGQVLSVWESTGRKEGGKETKRGVKV